MRLQVELISNKHVEFPRKKAKTNPLLFPSAVSVRWLNFQKKTSPNENHNLTFPDTDVCLLKRKKMCWYMFYAIRVMWPLNCSFPLKCPPTLFHCVGFDATLRWSHMDVHTEWSAAFASDDITCIILYKFTCKRQELDHNLKVVQVLTMLRCTLKPQWASTWMCLQNVNKDHR